MTRYYFRQSGNGYALADVPEGSEYLEIRTLVPAADGEWARYSATVFSPGFAEDTLSVCAPSPDAAGRALLAALSSLFQEDDWA